MSNKQTKSKMGKLDSYQSKAPEFLKLDKGDHEVKLVSYKTTDSFHNYDGSIKPNLPAYSNPTEQLVITVVSAKGKGGLTHRLNMDGYVRFNELTEKEVKSGKFVEIDEFACAKDPKTGALIRISDEARTKTCEGILDQMFAAMQIPVGEGIEALDECIHNNRVFVVNVTKEEYQGKDQLRIGSFKKVKIAVEEKSELDA